VIKGTVNKKGRKWERGRDCRVWESKWKHMETDVWERRKEKKVKYSIYFKATCHVYKREMK